MAAEKIGGTAGAAEGFRAARQALQGLGQSAGRSRPAARPGATRPNGEANPPVPTGRILSITQSEARAGVRPDKVLIARERIAQGYYDQSEVRGELVSNLLRSFGEQD